MKNSITLAIGIFFVSLFSVIASEEQNNNYYGNEYGKSYIFTEQNVEFSVYPDGQFDFTYLGNYNGSNSSLIISSPNVNISYNSGYNYDMYVQYDDYGAVIQVEDIPIYYDEFGRLVQAGSVEIRYYNSRIVNVGGLHIYYNNYGYYSYTTGYINPYNYYYVYRPWHSYYVRPVYASCVVYNYPYRRYYQPTRYTYNVHSNYYSNRGRSNIAYTNGRRSFNNPGSRVHYKNGRTAVNKEYKSNRKNTSVTSSSRDRKSSVKRSYSSSKNESKSSRYNTSSNNSNTRKVSYNRNNHSTKPVQRSNYKRSSNTTKQNKAVTTNKRNSSYKNNTRKTVATNSTRSSSSNRKASTSSRSSSSKRSRGL
ncbi:MAG: hypothetical protein COB12_01410 [Flavobacterium sp.]|nr:MAG: hypothetical protein COB12_01410 [Flavobacterium sp.]